MLRAWLRRLLGLEEVPTPREVPSTGLSQRVAELEEEVQFLGGALKRLRGRVTGSLRSAEEPASTDAPQGAVKDRDAELNEEIFRRRRGLSPQPRSN